MASLDPVAGAGQNVEALVAAELARLAADAAALHAQVQTGDVVQARVLPSNGLTDLLEILGRRVAASLPADLRPGDVISAQVTGFDGDRILLQVLAQDDAQPSPSAPSSAVFVAASIVSRPPDGGAPPPAAAPLAAAPPGPASPAQPEGSAPSTAGSAPSTAAPAAGPLPAAGANGASSRLAPPDAGIVPPARTPFVPAAGRLAPLPDAAPPPPGASRTIVVAPPRGSLPPPAAADRPAFLTRTPVTDGLPAALRIPPAARSSVAPPPAAPRPTLPGGAGAEPPRPTPPSTPIESRIVAARTGAAPLGPDFAGRPAPAVRPGGGVPPPPPPAVRGFVAPPPISPRGTTFGPPPVAPPAVAPPAAAAAAVARPEAPARTVASFVDPAAIVRALRLPVTPTNVASARLALESPTRLPAALDALERALHGTDDPRAQTLRTIAAFVGRLDPRSPALAAQLASYVDHVVDGGEAKLGGLLDAHAQTAAATRALEPPPAPTTPAPPGGAPVARDAGPVPPPPPSAAAAPALPALPVVAQAHLAERQLAVAHDLKSAVLALLASPPADAPPALRAALADVATTIAGQQIATAQSVTPQGVVLSFPIATPGGVAHAEVRVNRDAPDGSGRSIDGDDFHLAFVLETANLGVVALDLRTVGRAIDLAVQTETPPVARRFDAALADLRDRLESLRYTVASTDARVVARPGETVGIAPPSADAGPTTDPNALLDRRA